MYAYRVAAPFADAASLAWSAGASSNPRDNTAPRPIRLAPAEEPGTETREARLARLRDEVRDGTYAPDLDAVARKIIDADVL